jgi:hypothetical protein
VANKRDGWVKGDECIANKRDGWLTRGMSARLIRGMVG